MKLQRYAGNPILAPNPKNKWESMVTTNPGAWYDEKTREVYMLYRAAGPDIEHRIYLGLAVSKDGYHFERISDQPVFGPSIDGFDARCVEDPMIVKMDEYYYITYASRPFAFGRYWLPDEERLYTPPPCPPDFPLALQKNNTATGLALTKDFKNYIRAGRLTSPMLDDRDVLIFPEKINGKYVKIHRPMSWIGEKYGTENPAIWIASGSDLLEFGSSQILATAKYDWEGGKIGGNTPPIRTKYGWLFFYYAVGSDKHYRLGAMLLDLEDPTRVLHRTPEWLIQPEQDYELEGFYDGVIFPCGKVVIDGTLFVYYGGADKYVGLATCRLDSLLDYLKSSPK